MASFFLAPGLLHGPFFVPGGNTPANGGQLFFYIAGSSTKQTVFKDNAGGTAWSNPIVLDSGGNLPSQSEIWFTSGVSYKCIFAPSTDTDPPASPYATWDNLSGINDTGAATTSEWVSGPSPTYVSGTQFVLAGDQTNTFTIGRRLKTTNTGGTIYSRILTTSFGSASTTINVTSDSGSLDSGLSAVSYGILNPVNPSIPALRTAPVVFADSVDPSKTASVDMTAFATSTNAVIKPQFLASRVVSGATTNVNFTPTDFPWTTFNQYVFEIQQVGSSTNASNPGVRLSVNSGSTFLTSTYQYAIQFQSIISSGAFSTWTVNASNTGILNLSDSQQGLMIGSKFSYSARFRLLNPGSTSEAKAVIIDHIAHPQVASSSMIFGSGIGTLSSQIAAINGIEFMLGVGGANMTSGVISVYGLQN